MGNIGAGGREARPRAENFLREGGVGPRRSVLCLSVRGHLRKVKKFHIAQKMLKKLQNQLFGEIS